MNEFTIYLTVITVFLSLYIPGSLYLLATAEQDYEVEL